MELWLEFQKSPEAKELNAQHAERQRSAFNVWFHKHHQDEWRQELEERLARLDRITEELKKAPN